MEEFQKDLLELCSSFNKLVTKHEKEMEQGATINAANDFTTAMFWLDRAKQTKNQPKTN